MQENKTDKLLKLRQHLQQTEKPAQAAAAHPLVSPANDNKVTIKPSQCSPLRTKQHGWIAKHLPQLSPQITSYIFTQPVVHEVHAKTYGDPASISFLLLALKEQNKTGPHDAPILWCTTRYQSHDNGQLFAPGLLAFGLDPNRFIMISAKNDAELLWVLEEATRSKSFAAVVGHVEDISFTQTRRLSLATQTGVTPLFLHRPHHCQGASAAFSRWQIESQPSTQNPFDERAPGTKKLRAHLLRSRTGTTGSWTLEYETSTYPLLMVPPAANRKSTHHVAANTPRKSKDGHGFVG